MKKEVIYTMVEDVRNIHTVRVEFDEKNHPNMTEDEIIEAVSEQAQQMILDNDEQAECRCHDSYIIDVDYEIRDLPDVQLLEPTGKRD